MNLKHLLLTLLTALIACSPAQSNDNSPRFASSVVGTDFDFILDTDPSTFLCLEYKGQRTREMPDKTSKDALFQPAFVFMSYYDDGTSIDMALDIDFADETTAREEALRYVPRLGKLPTLLRQDIERLVIHKGNPDATAFSDIGLIVVYSDNATKRISTHDLEETIFHESVHASLDEPYAGSAAWLDAQASDSAFATNYASENPEGEDLAESALFAYTLIHHPERIPEDDATWLRNTIPARIAFIETLLPGDEPIFKQMAPEYPCDGSGDTFTIN